MTTKSKLSGLLGSPLAALIALAASNDNYKLFVLPEDVCPFTGKVTKERPVQEPKKHLRKIHERLQSLFRRVAAPPYAHGAVKGKSYRTNAVAHKLGERIATFDIKSFYGSTSESRVQTFFVERMHIAPDVAVLLTKLVCHRGFLPTGSPLSPILSLFANQPMFDELNKLALSYSMLFTCYIDDLTFSGAAIPRGLSKQVASIVERHGHRLSEKKTRIFRRNQSKHVTGVVIWKNEVQVPYSRMHKARAILKAIAAEADVKKKLSLNQKLCGLLGEAAFIDPRFASMAKKSYLRLRALEQRVVLASVPTP